MRACLPTAPGTIEPCLRECPEADQTRNRVPRTPAEIILLYLGQFTRFRRTRKIIKPRGITPVLCKDFVRYRIHTLTGKTIVDFLPWLRIARHNAADAP